MLILLTAQMLNMKKYGLRTSCLRIKSSGERTLMIYKLSMVIMMRLLVLLKNGGKKIQIKEKMVAGKSA